VFRSVTRNPVVRPVTKHLEVWILRFISLLRRRPSAPLVISFVALFVALGGVGYAATQLPPNSVGTSQLQNGSVGNWKLKLNSVGTRKIINGSVGAKQVNSSQVQLRVGTACSAGAVKAIAPSGSVTCTPTLPNEIGTSASPVTLGTSATQVATQSLAAGSSYLVLAYPHAVISGSAQGVEVDCTLSVPAGTATPATPTSTTKSLAVDLGTRTQAGTIPLVLPVAPATSAQTASVSCTHTATGTPAPTVKVDTTVNAIQTAANG
jgi:hypothetical protein